MLSQLREEERVVEGQGVEAEAMVEVMFEVGVEEMLGGTADVIEHQEAVAVHLEVCDLEMRVVEEVGLEIVLGGIEVEDKD